MKLLVVALLLAICVLPRAWAQDRRDAEARLRNEVAALTKEAERGNAYAQLMLGRMHQHGVGVARDDVRAAQWYRRAADQGNANAMSALALMYVDGLGVARDEEEALDWYRKSIQSELREFATHPVPFAGGEEGAVKAAASGNSLAQVLVGKMYLTGSGVPQSDVQAVRWLTEGVKGFAAAGARPALALLYEEGRGGLPRDKAEALRLYRKAAEQTTANLGAALAYSLTTGALSAAVWRVQDVTAMDSFKGEEIWKSYKRDGLYRLERSLLYGKVFEPGRDENELFPPWAEPGAPKGTRYSKWIPNTRTSIDLIPESTAAFDADPARWSSIDGVVPRGARMRITRVVFEQTIDAHNFYYIAVFVDGPFAGKPVLLNRISDGGLGKAQSWSADNLTPLTEP